MSKIVVGDDNFGGSAMLRRRSSVVLAFTFWVIVAMLAMGAFEIYSLYTMHADYRLMLNAKNVRSILDEVQWQFSLLYVGSLSPDAAVLVGAHRATDTLQEELRADIAALKSLSYTHLDSEHLRLLDDEITHFFTVLRQSSSGVNSPTESAELNLRSSQIYGKLQAMLQVNSNYVRTLLKRQGYHYREIVLQQVLVVGLSSALVAALGAWVYRTLSQHEDSLIAMTNYDSVANLPNRQSFLSTVSRAIAATRIGGLWALVLIDAHSVSWIDGAFGAEVGDALLLQIGSRLKGALGHKYTISRQGGRVFALLTPNLRDAGEACGVAERIVQLFRAPFFIHGTKLHVEVNVGVSLFPTHSVDAVELERMAGNAALHAAKAGKNRYQMFTRDIQQEIEEAHQLENDVKKAIAAEEFSLVYQPIVASVSGDVTGVEALLRWVREDGTSVSPMEFIPLIERNGDIVELGQWVLRTAFAELKAWQEQGLTDFVVSVNVSPRQLAESSFVSTVLNLLEETGVSPGSVVLEITENVLAGDMPNVTRVLRSLRATGIKVALDDFGTGYSSLSYLSTLPLDIVKIDRGFVGGDGTGGPCKILGGIVSIAQTLRLRVVAEGVETAAQRQLLQELGIDFLQGYHLSKPLPPQEVVAFLSSREVCRKQEEHLWTQ